MAYVKKHWEDQDVERQKTYEFEKNDDGSTKLIESFGEVKNLGTPVNAENMNRIEEGIAGCGIRKYNPEEKFELGEWVLGVLDGKKIIFESLKDENKGNNLENSEFWSAVDFNNSGGSNLFDLIQKDHILSFEEKEGLERLGEFVYKEAQDGRYGYSDFYQKCIEEYRVSSEEKIYEDIILPAFSSNTQDGITISDSRNNTTILLNIMNGSTTYNSVGAWSTYWININYGKKVKLYNYTITSDSSGNTEYPSAWELWGYNEELTDEPKEGINYTLLDTRSSQTFSSGQAITYSVETTEEFQNYRLVFKSGVEASGNGELKKIAFNAAQYLYSIYKNENGHNYYLIENAKDYIDKIYQDTGVAWYYGIDTAQERILLPRNDWYNARLKNIPVFGNGKPLGLTNGTTNAYACGTIDQWASTAGRSNAVLGFNSTSETLPAGSNSTIGLAGLIGISYDPDESGLIADLSVAEKENDFFVYMVVGNTSTKKARSEAIELTSSTNDTLPMFTPIYFDFKPNHASWLKAGAEASGEIYQSAYSELLKIVKGEETKYGEGFKVVKESEKLPDVDYSEYWVINENNQTFTAPLKLSFSPVSSGKVPVIGNGKAITVTNGENEYAVGIGNYSGNGVLVPWHDTSLLGHNVGEEISGANSLPTNNLAGLTTNPDLSGIVADLSGLKSDKAQLYFKVANALENIEAIDCGEVLEELNNKISKTECKAYIIQTYTNGTSGYRIWSDGYCEQWGYSNILSGGGNQTISFLKAYKDTSVMIELTPLCGYTSTGEANNCVDNLTATSFVLHYGQVNQGNLMWISRGYLSQGSY